MALAVVSRITDHVLVLKDGFVVESGSIREILRAPHQSLERGTLNSPTKQAFQFLTT